MLSGRRLFSQRAAPTLSRGVLLWYNLQYRAAKSARAGAFFAAGKVKNPTMAHEEPFMMIRLLGVLNGEQRALAERIFREHRARFQRIWFKIVKSQETAEEAEMFFQLENAKGRFRFYTELLSLSMGAGDGCMISDASFEKACQMALQRGIPQ